MSRLLWFVSFLMALVVAYVPFANAGGQTIASAAIPCATAEVGLRLSCSNASSRRALHVAHTKCYVGPGDEPTVVEPFPAGVTVQPRTTQVAVIGCPAAPAPVFCVTRVSSRHMARCALTAPATGQQSELR